MHRMQSLRDSSSSRPVACNFFITPEVFVFLVVFSNLLMGPEVWKKSKVFRVFILMLGLTEQIKCNFLEIRDFSNFLDRLYRF